MGRLARWVLAFALSAVPIAVPACLSIGETQDEGHDAGKDGAVADAAPCFPLTGY